MQVLKSSYTQVASFQPSTSAHVDDIMTQAYQATSLTDSSIKFSIRAPSYKSLMDSEALLFVKCAGQFKNQGGTAIRIKNPNADEYQRGAAVVANIVFFVVCPSGTGGGGHQENAAANMAHVEEEDIYRQHVLFLCCEH